MPTVPALAPGDSTKNREKNLEVVTDYETQIQRSFEDGLYCAFRIGSPRPAPLPAQAGAHDFVPAPVVRRCAVAVASAQRGGHPAVARWVLRVASGKRALGPREGSPRLEGTHPTPPHAASTYVHVRGRTPLRSRTNKARPPASAESGREGGLLPKVSAMHRVALLLTPRGSGPERPVNLCLHWRARTLR